MSVIAVDVGGSGSRWGATDGRRGSGPAVAVGLDGIDAVRILARVLSAARESAPSAPEVVVVGMTGLLGLVSDASAIHRAIREGWPDARTVVCSDAVSALVGAVGLHGGAVVAAGTGVIGFGSDFHEIWHRVDGWGHVLGDEGGGAWIGRHGLRAALRAHDGRPDGSKSLLVAAHELFGPLEGLPRQIYTRDDRAQVLAGFVPAVVEAASANDPVAVHILRSAGEHLAETGRAAMRDGVPSRIALTGGVARAGGPLVDAFAEALAGTGADVVSPEGDPLSGALRIGEALLADAAALSAHPPFLTKESL